MNQMIYKSQPLW